MRFQLRDDVAQHLQEMILALEESFVGKAKNPFKQLRHKLAPPRESYRLSIKDIEHLDNILNMSENILKDRTDERAEDIKTVLRYIRMQVGRKL